MPHNSVSRLKSGDTGGHSLSDVILQNEQAMWRAEFDAVGEEAVRSNVERNSYPATGMEVAREWLARREPPELHRDVPPIGATAASVQGAAFRSLGRASEESTLAGLVEANSRAIAEISADARKNARAMILIGIVASLVSLCAILLVLASSQKVAPNVGQSAAQPPKQASTQPSPPTPASTQPSPPTKAAARPWPPKQAAVHLSKRAAAQPSKDASAHTSKPAAVRPVPPAVPPPAIRQASDTPPDTAPAEQPSDAPPTASPDPKPQSQSLADVLALIADKVGGEGTIRFTAQFSEMATGRDYTQQLAYRTSNLTIDPNRCQLGFRWHVEQDGRTVSDQDRMVELRRAENISVSSIDVEPGRRFSMRAYPKVYVVHIARWDSLSGDDLYFRDRDTAARVGATARHAVELCDNGEQQFRRR